MAKVGRLLRKPKQYGAPPSGEYKVELDRKQAVYDEKVAKVKELAKRGKIEEAARVWDA